MNQRRLILAVAGMLALSPAVACADAIALGPYLSRVGRHSSALVVVALILLVMVINYGLNFLFIGFPAMRLGQVGCRQMVRDLGLLTLGGQFADRVGALLAVLSAGPVCAVFHLQGEGPWVTVLVILNFGFSAAAIGLLTFCFCRWRWGLAFRPTLIVILLAAVFTNPAYAAFVGMAPF